jgi:glucosamine--fructose-6-phosphate aminotransferase (isomerizing)
MCGIIALLSLNKDKTINILLDGLKQLQNRGYDSAGVCTINNDTFSLVKHASTKDLGSIQKIELNKENLSVSNIGIAHTRWATHGGKTDENSHPHVSFNNKVALVHNGIIENYSSLKLNLENEGIIFKSQTDTEVVSNLIAFNYDKFGDFTQAINESIKMMSGTWGLAIMNLDEPNKLYCVRHGSPILVSPSDEIVMISSEQSGFCGKTNNYFILDSNDICIITKHNNKITVNTTKHYELYDALNLNFDLSPQPYEHWTLKEISEQFDSSLRAISLGGRLLDDDKVRLGGLEGNKEVLKRIDNLIFLACGTSYYAALCGIHYFKDLCNFNTMHVIDGSEFVDNDIPKLGNTALVMLSQSGETKDLHRCISIGKERDLFIIGIINVVDSMIARECNCGCYLNAGREVGVASTKSFTNQVIVLSMMAVWFSQIHNKYSNKRKEYVSGLRNLPYDIKKTIDVSLGQRSMMVNLLNKPSLFLLGKGKSEAIAREGSLKIKEITYIHAEGYSGSALKHGPFALLDENLPVILIAPDNENYAKLSNAYEEIKSRNSPIVFITDNDRCDYDNTIILPKNKIYSDLLAVIPLQIAAYYLSIKRGVNPDMPRNLAKCVTVE